MGKFVTRVSRPGFDELIIIVGDVGVGSDVVVAI